MTKQEKRQVQAWLHSIKKTEFAIGNLERALLDLETRRESPPTWMRAMGFTPPRGGRIDISKQQVWVEFLEEYPARRSYLLDRLEQNKRKVEQYNQVIAELKQDQKWGHLGAEIVHRKYYQKVWPDSVIYKMYLFCTRPTFYRTHDRALRYFREMLPDVFEKK